MAELTRRYPPNLRSDVGSRVLLLSLLLPLLIALVPGSSAIASPPVGADIEVFTRTGCGRCSAAERFLAVLQGEEPQLVIVFHHIDRDPTALQRLKELAATKGLAAVGVPAFYLSDQLIIGFVDDDSTGAQVRLLLRGDVAMPTQSMGICEPEGNKPCAGSEDLERAWLPVFGSLAVRDLGLPLFTLVLGLVDGFNPCAMWVLLFLLSILVNVRSRARMLVIAGTFVVASGLIYFAFMTAWLNIFMVAGFSSAIRTTLALVAILVGVVNIKDFFALGRGFSFSIPGPAKRVIYSRVREILQARNLLAASASAIVLALFVNTVELLCTAGLPAVYTHILTQRGLPQWQYYAYLILYDVAYMLDDAVVVVGSVLTLSRLKLQESGGRRLKLVSGLVLLLLGLILLVYPQWLAFDMGRS